jgi:hypothetical protein
MENRSCKKEIQMARSAEADTSVPGISPLLLYDKWYALRSGIISFFAGF